MLLYLVAFGENRMEMGCKFCFRMIHSLQKRISLEQVAFSLFFIEEGRFTSRGCYKSNRKRILSRFSHRIFLD